MFGAGGDSNLHAIEGMICGQIWWSLSGGDSSGMTADGGGGILKESFGEDDCGNSFPALSFNGFSREESAFAVERQ